MKFISLKEIIESTPPDEVSQMIGVEQTKVQYAIAYQRDLTDCAIWLKNSIDTIDSLNLNGKLIREDGNRAFSLEALKDLYEEGLKDVQRILLADPSKI